MKRKSFVTAGILKYVIMWVIVITVLIMKMNNTGFTVLTHTGFLLWFLLMSEGVFLYDTLKQKERFSEDNKSRLKKFELKILIYNVLLLIIMFAVDYTSIVLTLPVTAIEVYRAASINLKK